MKFIGIALSALVLLGSSSYSAYSYNVNVSIDQKKSKKAQPGKRQVTVMCGPAIFRTIDAVCHKFPSFTNCKPQKKAPGVMRSGGVELLLKRTFMAGNQLHCFYSPVGDKTDVALAVKPTIIDAVDSPAACKTVKSMVRGNAIEGVRCTYDYAEGTNDKMEITPPENGTVSKPVELHKPVPGSVTLNITCGQPSPGWATEPKRHSIANSYDTIVFYRNEFTCSRNCYGSGVGPGCGGKKLIQAKQATYKGQGFKGLSCPGSSPIVFTKKGAHMSCTLSCPWGSTNNLCK